MKRDAHLLLFIVLTGFGIRLAILPFVQFMGINDPNHYYNLALNLLNGKGFNLDYLWHFSLNTETLYTPFEFWQPMAAILAAGSMWLFGEGIQQSLLPFILAGSLLPLVSYTAAKHFKASESSSLFVAAATAFLPEFVINSLRTDTLIPNSLFLCTSLLFLTKALETGRWSFFTFSGIFAGLAYLTRGDNLLLIPMLFVSLAIYYFIGRKDFIHSAWWRVILVPFIALTIVSPWLWRNEQVLGNLLGAGNLLDTMFYADFRDHYSYQREFSLESLLAQQRISDLVVKRFVEGMAALRLMVTSLGALLPVAVISSLFSLLYRRDKILLKLLPGIILLGGMAFAYVVLVPIANQGGSFKKSYLSLIPLILPLAAYAFDHFIVPSRKKILVMLVTLILLLQSAFAEVLIDMRHYQGYLGFLGRVDEALQSLPDTNGDGEVIVMTQDPFALRYIGYRGLQIPMEDRETILAVAQRYRADYILFPPARPSLDPIQEGTESDDRLVYVRRVSGTSTIYRFNFEGEE